MKEILCIQNFLGDSLRVQLLEFAIRSESRFDATLIGSSDGAVRPSVRRSRRLCYIDELHHEFETRVRAVFPRLVQELGVMPFNLDRCEIEMAVHADADFYKRHVDTFTGSERSHGGDRIISCVYYFYQLPRAFGGGELKLYPLPTTTRRATDPIIVAPENDLFVAFSSWMPHEVLPVRFPSQDFAKARFSVNCWLYRSSTGDAKAVA
jgi:SM-20-related protein